MNRHLVLALTALVGLGLGASFGMRPAQASSTKLYGTVNDPTFEGKTTLIVDLRDPISDKIVATRTVEATVHSGRYIADLGPGVPSGLFAASISAPSGAPLAAVDFVQLQPSAPGTQQAGNVNINGSLLAGKIGVPSVNAGAMINAIGTGGVSGLRGQSDGTGVLGSTTSVGGAGISGNATAATGSSSGVIGFNSSPDGFGVRGNGGPGVGVRGQTASTTLPAVSGSGIGIGGHFAASELGSFGVVGESTGTKGRGVKGIGDFGVEGIGTTGAQIGLSGSGRVGINAIGANFGGIFESTGTESAAVKAENGADLGTGLFAAATGSASVGVDGSGTAFGGRFFANGDTSVAVRGETRGTGNAIGGSFESTSPTGRGVRGLASAVSGANFGGWFTTLSPNGTGAIGSANSATGPTVGLYGTAVSTAGKGVLGEASASTGFTFGGDFVSNSKDGVGVRARNASTGSFGLGAEFLTAATAGTAMRATATSATGNPTAIQALTSAPSASAMFANCSAATGATIGVKAQLASADGKPFVAQNLALGTTVEVGGKNGAVKYDKGHVTKQFGASLFSMSPIAYGTVNSGGTKAGGTGNWSIAFDSGTKVYTITLAQDNLVQGNFVLHATPLTTDFVTGHSSPAVLFNNANPNQLKVHWLDANNNGTSQTFMFVVYGQVPVIAGPPQGP